MFLNNATQTWIEFENWTILQLNPNIKKSEHIEKYLPEDSLSPLLVTPEYAL